MKNKFKTQKNNEKFKIIKNFISSNKAKELSQEFKKYCEENPDECLPDCQIPGSPAKYNYDSFLELLCEKTPMVSDIIGEPVLPTYSYARVYQNGDVLKKHTDRDACEVSLTVHLDGDKEWEIFVEDSNQKIIPITLQSGDALLYYGCEIPHWRDEYYGTFYSQLFLHYVKSKGSRQLCYFDKNNIEDFNVLKNYINIIENAVPLELCDRIIEEYNDEEWGYALISSKEIDLKTRNCRLISISIESTINKNFEIRKKIDNDIFLSTNKILNELASIYKNLPVSEDTGYGLLKYEEGSFYTQHTDSYTEHPRTLSCSLCLNDDYEGGEFAFFDRKLKYKLKKGSAIVFPSNFMYPHEIMPVIKGTRYSIITWFR